MRKSKRRANTIIDSQSSEFTTGDITFTEKMAPKEIGNNRAANLVKKPIRIRKPLSKCIYVT